MVRGRACKFVLSSSEIFLRQHSPPSHSLQYIRTVSGPAHVQFVSNTEMLCRQPDMADLGPFPDPSYLEVSVDGQKFSQSLTEYHVVGPQRVIEPSPKVRLVGGTGAKGQHLTRRARAEAFFYYLFIIYFIYYYLLFSYY